MNDKSKASKPFFKEYNQDMRVGILIFESNVSI